MHLDEVIKIKPYEKIVYVIRAHWLTFMPTLGLFLLLGLVPFGVYFILMQTAPELVSQQYPHAFLTLLFSVYELSVALFFYSSFLMYYLDMMIVTNDRMIQIQQKTLFSRSVSELDLYKIQDSKSDVTGVIATMLGYGMLHIQTAGENTNFTFEAVPRVNEVRRQIMQMAEEDRKYHIGTPTHTP